MQCDGNIPTYKAVEGIDLNSSAFYTALKMGLDEDIINRAQQIANAHDPFAVSRFKNYSANTAIKSFANKNNSTQFIKETLAVIAGESPIQVKTLQENQIPSLNDIGYSVVYILKTSNNFFYVGETDNFLHRIKAHQTRLSNSKCEFFYIAIKKGKSEARKIEQKLILKLKNSGLPMLSISDATNLNFGG